MIAKEHHPDTMTLADTLAAHPVGEVVTLDALSAAIGRDIAGCRHRLYSAVRFLERERGAVFESVRGIGYRRVTTEEIVKVGITARAKIRGAARRGSRTISAGMQFANDMPDDTRRKLLSEQSSLGLLNHLARDKALPVVPDDARSPMPPAKVARAFLEAIGAVKAA